MTGYIGIIDDLTINEENRLRVKLQQVQVKHTEEWELVRQEMAEIKKQLRRYEL